MFAGSLGSLPEWEVLLETETLTKASVEFGTPEIPGMICGIPGSGSQWPMGVETPGWEPENKTRARDANYLSGKCDSLGESVCGSAYATAGWFLNLMVRLFVHNN